MKAIIYARFSPRPRRGGKECASIETQVTRCRQQCAANGWSVVGEYADRDLSGASTENRPGWQQCIEHVTREKAVLVVYALSRMARSTLDAIEIVRTIDTAGAQLVSLSEKIDTTNAMGRFVFKVMVAMDEMERERIAERTSEAMLTLQENGYRMGRYPPYGTMLDPADKSRIIPNPEEEMIIERALEYYDAGMSIRKIARCLTAEELFCREAPWNNVTLGKIIRRSLAKRKQLELAR